MFVTPCMSPVCAQQVAAAAAAAAAAGRASTPCPGPHAQVAAWRARGRVPLGVDSTACLVEAQQRDAAAASLPQQQQQAQQQQQTAPASESELRLQYAMAVVRMVNGIADSSQRGRVAASVASLASAAGQHCSWVASCVP